MWLWLFVLNVLAERPTLQVLHNVHSACSSCEVKQGVCTWPTTQRPLPNLGNLFCHSCGKACNASTLSVHCAEFCRWASSSCHYHAPLDATRAAPVEDIFCQTCKECGPDSMLRLQKEVRQQEQRLKAREEELTEIIQISKKEQDEMKESRSRAGKTDDLLDRTALDLGAMQVLKETKLQVEALENEKNEVEKLRQRALKRKEDAMSMDAIRFEADELQKEMEVQHRKAFIKKKHGDSLVKVEARLADVAAEERTSILVQQGIQYLEGRGEKRLQEADSLLREAQVHFQRVKNWKNAAKNLKEVAGEVAEREQQAALDLAEHRSSLETRHPRSLN